VTALTSRGASRVHTARTHMSERYEQILPLDLSTNDELGRARNISRCFGSIDSLVHREALPVKMIVRDTSGRYTQRMSFFVSNL
jgi:hypothetical protein